MSAILTFVRFIKFEFDGVSSSTLCIRRVVSSVFIPLLRCCSAWVLVKFIVMART